MLLLPVWFSAEIFLHISKPVRELDREREREQQNTNNNKINLLGGKLFLHIRYQQSNFKKKNSLKLILRNNLKYQKLIDRFC